MANLRYPAKQKNSWLVDNPIDTSNSTAHHTETSIPDRVGGSKSQTKHLIVKRAKQIHSRDLLL